MKHIVHSMDLRGVELVPMEVMELFACVIGDSILGSRSCGVADAGHAESEIPDTSCWM
jgi:hypothetical protein